MRQKIGLTSGRLLARNTIWNLGANVASIFIALFSVPILLRYLGTDRLGVISLIWIVEGQFSIFDLGLSLALTKLVSEKLGTSKEHEVPSVFWSSIAIMFAFGVLGAVILRLASPWLVHTALKVPIAIQSETLSAFRYVAISLPVVISLAGLRGFISAYQRFDLLSVVRVPISLFSYLIPLTVIPFSRSLAPFVLVLVFSRFLAWFIHIVLCFRVAPIIRTRITVVGAPLRNMFSFGGWMTVTNIVSPIMVSMDRLLIGTLISMAAVAYYATPYEAATKLFIISSSIMGVLFPAFSSSMASDRDRAALLFERGIKYIFISMFPIVLFVLALGSFVLHVWLGKTFADNSNLVLQLLVLGVFANSLAQIPFWQIQAAGRPDLAAKVHLIEMPFYLVAFWALTSHYGIVGAGIAWMLRTVIDACIMFWLSHGLLPETSNALRRLRWACIGATPILGLAIAITDNLLAGIYVAVICTIFSAITWLYLLSAEERQLVRNPFRLFMNRHESGDALPTPDPSMALESVSADR